ncbi:hypothetical protein AB4851_10990 [Burkholderia sp. 22PA0099]
MQVMKMNFKGFGVGFGGFTRPINLGGSGSTGFSFPVGTLPGMQPKRN